MVTRFRGSVRIRELAQKPGRDKSWWHRGEGIVDPDFRVAQLNGCPHRQPNRAVVHCLR